MHKSCNNLLKYVEESTAQFKKAKVDVVTLKTIFIKTTDDKAITDKIKQKKTWDETFIAKYHCPLRFQGNAIVKSIEHFKTNLSNLNLTGKVQKNAREEYLFPYNVNKWSDNIYLYKKFVIFTNVRLDFTPTLCKENLLYQSICNSYNESILFSHDLLYGKDQQKRKEINEENEINRLLKKFNKSQYQGKMEVNVDSNVVIDTREKKKVKKTSTRSFRKRGRRRGPSETEIL